MALESNAKMSRRIEKLSVTKKVLLSSRLTWPFF